MREPALVPGPQLLPGTCGICGTNQGPVVDTTADIRGYGRFYLCTRTCLPLIADTAGYLTPEKKQRVADAVRALDRRVSELEEELAHERSSKVMAFADIAAYFDEHALSPERAAELYAKKPGPKAKAAV